MVSLKVNGSEVSQQCSGGGGGGRPPNPRERRVFDLWDELGLSSQSFAGGQGVAFLHQVQRLLR